MLTVNHNYSNLIFKEEIDFADLFSRLNRTRQSLQELINAVKEEDYDDILDAADDILIDMDMVKMYSEYFISNNPVLNQTITRAVTSIEEFTKDLQEVCSLNSDTLQEFSDRAKYVCGVYATILYFDFGLTGINLEDVSKSSIESCVRSVTDNMTDEQLKDFVMTLFEEISWCRSSINAFVLYPDLEEPFYNIMGPSAALLDDEFLTIDDINDIISGELDPDALIQLIAQRSSLSNEDDVDVKRSGVF